MIARSWRGAVQNADAEAYAAYIDETGMQAYADTPGNRGAWMLTREIGASLTEFVTLSASGTRSTPIQAFAGEDYDDRGLLSRGRSLPRRARPRPARHWKSPDAAG